MTTIGSDNLTNGPGKPERFGGKYRGARRDTVLTEVVSTDSEIGGRERRSAGAGRSAALPALAGPEPADRAVVPAGGLADGAARVPGRTTRCCAAC